MLIKIAKWFDEDGENEISQQKVEIFFLEFLSIRERLMECAVQWLGWLLLRRGEDHTRILFRDIVKGEA